jgi:hypothetical protein
MAIPNRSNVTFPASSGIVTLAEAKQHLSLFSDDTFDSYINDIIVAATIHAGTFIGQSLEVEGVIDYFRSWESRLILSHEYIETIAAVRAYSRNKGLIVVSPSDYMIDSSGFRAAVVFTTPQTTDLSTSITNPIQVEYSSLFVDAAENRAIKQAVLIIVGDMFKDRETNTEGGSTRSHLTAERLLAPYRSNLI